MKRIVEPELMEGKIQCEEFASASRKGLRDRFIREITAVFELEGATADLGCGPADYSNALCEVFPNVTIDAYDGSAAMLEIAKLTAHKNVTLIYLPFEDLDLLYENVVSTNTLHHIHDPAVFWKTIDRITFPGSKIFVMDLVRPDEEEHVAEIIQKFAATDAEYYKEDFANSLRAAFTPGEVRCQIETILPKLTIKSFNVANSILKIMVIYGTK